MKTKHLVISALIIAAILGSIAPIFSKLALREFSPIAIASFRTLFAGIILFGISLISKQSIKIQKIDIIKIIIVGTFFAGNILLFVLGIKSTTSIISQLIYLLCPIYILILNFIFYHNKPTKFQLFSVIFGLTGAGILLFKSWSSSGLSNSLGTFQGNIIIFGASFCWACYLFFSKKLTQKYPPIIVLTYSSFIVFALSFPMLLREIFSEKIIINAPTSTGIMSIIALILLNSVLCFILYQWGNKHSSSFATTSIAYISPFSTAIISIPLLGEKIGIELLFSALCIFISSYFVFQHHQRTK